MFCSPHLAVKQQIAALLATQMSEIEMKYVDVQMQSGHNECGMFAIAYATTLCLGEQPDNYILEQGAVRRHLIKFLEKGTFDMFPVRKTRRQSTRIKSTATIKVFCDCRMPELPSSGMVQCKNCREWYHLLCTNKSTRPEVYLVLQFMCRITSLYNYYILCRTIYSCSTNISSSNSLNNSHPDQIFSNPNHRTTLGRL